MISKLLPTAALAVFVSISLAGADGPALSPAVLSELTWRNIGPAITSGRIVDIAVPEGASNANANVFYVASASGGLWKTTNSGTTFEPVFDRESTISIGDVAIAPSNPDIVWVGTGEANNQRSSSWGDGIYKSVNGGKTWTPMGLKGSQHIGRIIVHPTNPDVVYVAALGPLWASGRERGLFKTTDGGKTWTNTKSISEHTGFVDLAMDPNDPDVLYAAAYQRERRAYSFLGGGPEGGIYKTTDAGATWRKLTEGLPEGDVGRIGLSISRSHPATIYAIVQAREGGVFRSDDYGESWRRTFNADVTPWYYSQIRVDPNDPERVYTLAINVSVSEDGGKTFRTDVARTTHVDHHAMWIDPRDSNHLIIGNDGGCYISHDRGKAWDFVANLPVAQFYAIAADMREPFYYVYGGTQDNRSWGAPSATRNRAGITNADWYQTVGGDGFYSAVDYSDPNIVYAESQEGGVVRYDAKSGERKAIKPQPAPGKPPYRWNWSAPILVSPHDPKTVYFAANFLFKSPDRGDSWQALGGDLTRQRNRDTLPMMGKVWDRTAISRHEGTAPYGNISTLDESPLKKGLLYVGTDDGLVQVSRDGGGTWTKIDKFPGVPDETYVSRVTASPIEEGTVFATFDGHRSNDFKPYVLKSTDYGASWHVDHRQPARVGFGVCDSPAPAQRIAALCRNGIRCVCVDRRRRRMDAAQEQPADRCRARSDRSPARKRSDPRHARARRLDSRRHHTARKADAGGAGIRVAAVSRQARIDVQPGGSVRRRIARRRRSGRPAVRRVEPAVRRGDFVLRQTGHSARPHRGADDCRRHRRRRSRARSK